MIFIHTRGNKIFAKCDFREVTFISLLSIAPTRKTQNTQVPRVIAVQNTFSETNAKTKPSFVNRRIGKSMLFTIDAFISRERRNHDSLSVQRGKSDKTKH